MRCSRFKGVTSQAIFFSFIDQGHASTSRHVGKPVVGLAPVRRRVVAPQEPLPEPGVLSQAKALGL